MAYKLYYNVRWQTIESKNLLTEIEKKTDRERDRERDRELYIQQPNQQTKRKATAAAFSKLE